jgi:two-component system OmpR family response regulator
MHLLVADSDARVAAALLADLVACGHQGVVAGDGRQALAMAVDGGFDAMLADAALRYVDGIALVALLRERGIDLPIILTSEIADPDQRIAGLDAGADDYLIKPVFAAEIAARLRAILRRSARGQDAGVLRAGDIEISEIKHRATRAGRPLALQNLEFRLLCELVRHTGTVVTREQLYRNVWHYDAVPATNIVESYIRRLRQRLNQPGERDPITTIRGIGYMLAPPK